MHILFLDNELLEKFAVLSESHAREYLSSGGLKKLMRSDKDFFFKLILSECLDLDQKIAALVEAGLDINARSRKDPKGLTPLFRAVQAPGPGVIRLAEVLIENGADVDAPSEEGLTPLHCAVMLENVGLIEFLVSKGADLNRLDARNRSCVHLYVMADSRKSELPIYKDIESFWPKFEYSDGWSGQNTRLLDLLISLGADFGPASRPKLRDGALDEIVEFGNLRLNRWLFRRGFRPSHRMSERHATTLLMFACGLAKRKCALFWISKCDTSDLELSDGDGRTPLLWAGDAVIARALIEKGADVGQMTKDGSCVFVSHGSIDVEMFSEFASDFVRAGGDINARRQGGRTVIHMLLDKGRFTDLTDALELAIDLGVDVNAKDDEGKTPLMLADEGLAVALLWLGADPALRDNSGDTALVRAAAANSRGLSALLGSLVAAAEPGAAAKGGQLVLPRRADGFSSSEAMEAYKSWKASRLLSSSKVKPPGMSHADWLITLDPAYAKSAIAAWEGRHDCELLKLTAELYALCPDFALDPAAFDILDNEYSLLDYVMAAAAWAIEVVVVPFTDYASVDRKSSMIGGFPWTCERHPWPTGSSGALSPVYQLNLAQLDLSRIAEFPPVIVQAWGDGIDFLTRVIPLADLEGVDPSRDPLAYENLYLFYDRGDTEQAGAILSTGKAVFALPTEGLEYPVCATESGLYMDLEPGDFKSKINVVIERFRDEIFASERSLPKFVRSNHFGGQHHPIQWFYEPSDQCRALFEYGSATFKGLCIYADGSMQVSYSPADMWNGFQTHASR